VRREPLLELLDRTFEAPSIILLRGAEGLSYILVGSARGRWSEAVRLRKVADAEDLPQQYEFPYETNMGPDRVTLPDPNDAEISRTPLPRPEYFIRVGASGRHAFRAR
jgi:hypothetical protein